MLDLTALEGLRSARLPPKKQQEPRKLTPSPLEMGEKIKNEAKRPRDKAKIARALVSTRYRYALLGTCAVSAACAAALGD